MTKYVWNNSSILFLITSALILIACGGGGNTSNSKSDQSKDFSKSSSLAALRESILTVPENIQLTGEASSGKKSKRFKNNKGLTYDGLWANNYAAITDTINYSDLVKKNVISFLDYIFESKNLASAELNTFIETGEGEIWAYKLEDISNTSGEIFKWKLSIYFRFSQTADVICRFTFVDGKMKGQILENGYVTLDVTLDDETTTLTTYITYDIRFDGTVTPQKLDINYVKDLREIFNFVELYWSDLTEEQFEMIKVGQIGKSSVKILFDGVEYSITGTSYSPGATFESKVNFEIPLYGEDRSTYSFRAKSITGVVDGAKMEVALPKDTSEDINELWVNDSISNLFQKNILAFMNSYFVQLLDATDDSDLVNETYYGSVLLESVDFSGSILNEQQIGINTLYAVIGNKIAIPTLTEHGSVISSLEFDAAVTFWGTSSFTAFNTNSVGEINALLASTDIAISNDNKEEVYYQVLAPSIITVYQATPVSLSISDIELYLERLSSFFSIGLLNLINANKYIVNPAFFEKEIGFLGTFDGTSFYQYELFTDTLEYSETKPENFDIFNALDLTTLDAIKPINVFNLTIEVK